MVLVLDLHDDGAVRGRDPFVDRIRVGDDEVRTLRLEAATSSVPERRRAPAALRNR